MGVPPNPVAGTGLRPAAWRWAAALVALVLAGWAIWWFLGLQSTPQPQRKVTQIAVLRPPPPPPPPKTPEKPPEPPKGKEEVKLDPPTPVDEPKPADAPKEAPPPGPLGVDAQGTGPGDGFGLAGRPGGRDITLGASGGGGLNHSLFANGVARHIAQELARQNTLRSVEYRVELRVWIGRDGRIERWEIARGSGDAALDRALGEGLARVAALRQPAPEGLAQPLRIRVTSADA